MSSCRKPRKSSTSKTPWQRYGSQVGKFNKAKQRIICQSLMAIPTSVVQEELSQHGQRVFLNTQNWYIYSVPYLPPGVIILNRRASVQAGFSADEVELMLNDTIYLERIPRYSQEFKEEILGGLRIFLVSLVQNE
jgi:hypothetical protein